MSFLPRPWRPGHSGGGTLRVGTRLRSPGAGRPYLICISTLRLWRKCPAKARQSTGVRVA